MFDKAGPISIPSSKLNPANKASPGEILAVHKEEVVEGRIIKPISSRHALILIKGKQLLARTEGVILKPGQLASFKVTETFPQCVLKFLEVTSNQRDGITGLLKGCGFRASPFDCLTALLHPLRVSMEKSASEIVPPILIRMGKLLGRISLRPHDVAQPEFLKSFIDGSGLMWENKLKTLLLSGLESRHQTEALIEHDLKGLAFKSLADGSIGRLLSTQGMTTFLGETEHHQWWNLFALEEKGKLLFIIPMQWPDKFTFAQLLIDLGAKRGDRGKNHEDRVFKLSLFLDMSHLGPVRVDASVVEQAIRVSFLVSNESIQSFLNQCTPGLQQQLERHGFSLQQVTCRLEERASLAATSLADAIIDSEEHTISLIV
ncbi:MAG: flagellar hook-length control protein FliK [Deltaproteobacteria bacterium]|jgi:hypothetical protein